MQEELDTLSVAQLELVEHELFDIVDRAVSARRNDLPPAAVGDSFAVRAYLPWRRSFGDIDLVFPKGTDPGEIRAFAEGCPDHADLVVGDGSDGCFQRVKYVVPQLEKLGSDFRIDFHIGGIWHKDHLFGVGPEFTSSAHWVDVPSVDGGAHVQLPVPAPEQLLVLKLVKFIGGDQADVLSILSGNELDLDAVVSALVARGETHEAIGNLVRVRDELSEMLESWSYRYGRDLPVEGLPTLNARRDELQERLTAADD